MENKKPDPGAEYELKYVFNNYYASMLIEWLRLRCEPDPLFESGIVSSIYYDTADWRFIKEKINSDYLKTKVRIRWYEKIGGGYQGAQSFLEAKYKIGAKRKKARLKTDISSEWLSKANLGDMKLLRIPTMLWSLGLLPPASLYPAFQISYKRFRFIDPVTRSRVCIDYDICAPRANWQLLPKTFPVQLDKGVFELKGNINELPDVLKQMTALGCQKNSFSKYSNCYLKLQKMTF